MSNLRKIFFVFLLPLAIVPVFAQSVNVTVKGQVTELDGTPIEAVALYEEGNISNGGITDSKGNYSITVPKGAFVVFTSLGYLDVRKKINGNQTINVVMPEDSEMLEGASVVSVGYGTVSKRDLTGSVAKVDMESVMKSPVVSFDTAIAGRVAGVVVSSSDGEVGSTATITIRGSNSLTQSNEPLYVIDGFPSESSNATTLNPADIESIDILKDASATAIYGARGANGVIVITTKTGSEGVPVVNFTASATMGNVTRLYKLLDAYEFVRLQDDIYTVRGTTHSYTNGYDDMGELIGHFYSVEDYRNAATVDWQDKVYRTALTQNYNISVSGGNAKSGTRYNVNLAALNQQGIILNSDFQRYSGKVSFIQKIGKRGELDVKVNYASSDKSGISPTDGSSYFFYSVWGYRPTTPLRFGRTSEDIVDASIDFEDGKVLDSRYNPMKSLQNEYRKRFESNFSVNGAFSFDIIDGLKLRISGAFLDYSMRNEEFNGSNTTTGNPYSATGRGVNGGRYYYIRKNWLNENTISYTKSFGEKHRFNAIAGITFQGDNYSYNGTCAYQMTNESLGLNGLHTGIYQTVIPWERNWTLMSYLGRINYSYDFRYYLTASFRADGSSKFPEANRMGYFPSASVAWNFNRESWLKNVKWLANGKIRASWGYTGNNRTTTPYDYYAIMSTTPGSTATFDYVSGGKIVPGYYQSNMENPNLKWETTEQYDIGLDLGFLNNRIKFTADVYLKNTRDLLLNASLPASSGYTQAMLNIGSLRNKGLEFTVDLVPFQKRHFEWDFSANIAFNKNEVLELSGDQDVLLSVVNFDSMFSSQYGYITQVGKPAGLMYGYLYEGTYKPGDFDGAGLKKGVPYVDIVGKEATLPGYPKYKDINGDGIISDDDRTVIGCGQPMATGGFTNSFRIYDFDLNVFFQWSYGNNIINANRLVFENPSRVNLNQFVSVVDRYSAYNTTSDITIADAEGTNYYSSRAIEDGSYLRLKTLSLGYNIPAKVLAKVRMKEVRIYVSGENLWTLTNYSGNDPEVSTRQSVLTPGFDWSPYPRTRNLTAGLSIKF